MDEQDNSQVNAEIKILKTELVPQENDVEKVSIEEVPEPQEKIENNSEVFTNSENGNEVITIVAQENDGEIYIYDRNENDAVQTENTSDFIQVCDSNDAFEGISNSENKQVVDIDVTNEEVKEGHKSKISDGKDGEVEIVNCQEENGGNEEVQEVNEDVKEVNEAGNKINEEGKELNDGTNNCNNSEEKLLENSDGNQLKNYKNVILEDWDVEVPHVVENHESEIYGETVVVEEEPQITEIVDTHEAVTYPNDNFTVVGVIIPEEKQEISNENKEKEENSVSESQKENAGGDAVESEIPKPTADKKLDSLKYSKSITKNDIVKILDESTERVVRPIVTGKDLFFSIELTKRLNQKFSLNKSLKNSETGDKNNVTNESESCNNNNMVDDRQKIVDILEADEIKDWKSVPSKSDLTAKENGNDMEISDAIKNMQGGGDSNVQTPSKTPKRSSPKKFRLMDKELERMIALQQLREEFPSTRKRSRTTKKVNHIPFLASTVLEKALTSPEVTTALKPGPPRRRPCYLPENVSYSKSSEDAAVEKSTGDKSQPVGNKNKRVKAKSDGELVGVEKSKNLIELDVGESSSSSVPGGVVKTYAVKRKSTDAENDIKSTLETIAAVTKAFSESTEEASESKPKKQKTVEKPESKNKNKLVVKRKKKKLKVDSDKKRNSELEKLLGDEGAVRMLYDTQHGENTATTTKKSKPKTTTGLKKDLVLKTKLVKNAVMRLSGVGSEGVSLRGKRRSIKSKSDVVKQETEPLFSSTPNIVLYKPKKKQRAEASRILYRHSSSESFDSSEGYRRTSIDADGLNASSKEAATFSGDKSEEVNSTATETEKVSPKVKAKKSEIFIKRRLKRLQNAKRLAQKKEIKVPKAKGRVERMSTDSLSTSGSKLNLSNVPVRKSSRPRMISKKYSIWSSTSMDSLSVECLGLKKLKKASTDLGKKLNCKDLIILQYEHLVQVVMAPVSTLLKNSFNHEVLQELTQVFSFLSEDDNCKAVLLTSTGSTFCQGIDINQIVSFSENGKKNGVSQLAKSVREFITCLSEFKKPVIVGVHAAAVGLGVTLLPYCDLILCSDKASFYTPYVKLGQAPEGAPTYTFPRISRQLVSELLIRSHKMTASDALKHGLVTQVIPEERFEEELILVSRNLAAQPIQGMQSIKFLLRSNDQEEIVENLQIEGEMLEEHWSSSECLNNMIRFLNSGELQLRQLDNT